MGLMQAYIVTVFKCCNPTVARGLHHSPTPLQGASFKSTLLSSLSPLAGDPEHTSLAAGMGEQRQLLLTQEDTPALDCSNCLMFCVCLHIPVSAATPPVSLESLLLSLIHTCSHIHTNTHGCVPSLAHSCLLFTKQK